MYVCAHLQVFSLCRKSRVIKLLTYQDTSSGKSITTWLNPCHELFGVNTSTTMEIGCSKKWRRVPHQMEIATIDWDPILHQNCLYYIWISPVPTIVQVATIVNARVMPNFPLLPLPEQLPVKMLRCKKGGEMFLVTIRSYITVCQYGTVLYRTILYCNGNSRPSWLDQCHEACTSHPWRAAFIGT